MKQTLPFLLILLASTAIANTTPQFHIECPLDITVDCNDELWDLSIYGKAYIYGYGDTIPAGDPVENYYLNSCNVGSITRTWTVSDYAGNDYTCKQTITVISDANYDDLNIQWPEDYQTSDCTADLSPDQLSPPYDYPTWDQLSCAMIMKNYKDKTYKVDEGCVKVIRTWTLLDWCSYDPNDPNPTGIWKHTQILKIMSTEGPSINCIPDLTVSAGSNCNSTYVDLQEVTASNNCMANVEVTNNSPYSDNGKGDASGFYPIGTTMIKFTARDACGNESYCKVKLTVVDQKKPVPICIHGISASLGIQPDGYYVRLFPELFNKGSYDNCTPKEELKIEVVPEILSCDELDTTPVKVIVTDQNGNSNYCTTYVYLTDNLDRCPSNSTYSIAGSIRNIRGQSISNLNLQVDNDNVSHELNVDEEGNYQLEDLQLNEKYDISFDRQSNPEEGWSTLDQIMIRDYIKGNYTIGIESGIASADLDEDGMVSAYDIWLHKQFMLKNMALDQNLQEWKVVNATSLKQRTKLPPAVFDVFPDNTVADTTINKDLVLIKMGDIDASAEIELSGRDDNPVMITVSKERINAGESTLVRYSFDQDIDLLGYQYTIKFDPEKIESIDINYLDVEGLSKGDFGLNTKEDGLIPCSFISEEVINFKKGDSFLSLNIKSKEDCMVYDVLNLTDDVLKAEVYEPDYNHRTIHLNDAVTASRHPNTSMVDMTVYPNPVSENTLISFDLPDRIDHKQSKLRILNMDGSMILNLNEKLTRGSNSVAFSTAASYTWPAGIYIIQLITPQGIISKRVLKE
jgi:hypothetical protein